MKLGALAVLGWAMWQGQVPAGSGVADAKHFQYQRQVGGVALQGAPRSVCTVLDGAVFAHAEPTLADVRLYHVDGATRTEVPYVMTSSQTALTSDAATVISLGIDGTDSVLGTHIVFDLQMPARPYTDVELDLGEKNFLATAKVTGRQSLLGGGGVYLGAFTLFDLSGQGLGRSTTLPLSESAFPVLHVDLQVKPTPQRLMNCDAHCGDGFDPAMVKGAEVPPSRQAQTLYTVLESTGSIVVRGRESVATFNVPAHVPIERVSFVMAAGDNRNFSRDVRVTAPVAGSPEAEQMSGMISRVRLMEGGQEIREESLSFPAVLGANSRDGAKVEVAVENGDDRPLAIAAVRLEMRERKLCFDASAGDVELFYGDAALKPAVYDYARTFEGEQKTQTIALGAEMRNASFEVPADQRTLTERHPEVIWLALLGVVGALGVVAFRSAKKV